MQYFLRHARLFVSFCVSIAFLFGLLAVRVEAQKRTLSSTDSDASIPDESGGATYRMRQTVTLRFEGPQAAESAERNPFTDSRLLVTLQNSDSKYVIRGFFAADGNAANTSAESGNVWMCRFCPDTSGTWSYTAELRTGSWLAIDTDPEAGELVEIAGAQGEFEVTNWDSEPQRIIANTLSATEDGDAANSAAAQASATNFYRSGRLQQQGHYFSLGPNQTWLKFGSNSPENLLAYSDFDGTFRMSRNSREGEAAIDNPIHDFLPHLQDFRENDPTWAGGKGKGIVGVVNYLAQQGMNSMYFLSLNIEGDGKDVWPYRSPDDFTRFDCSKLDQWEVVFEHMQQSGIAMHVITQETENEFLLDEGNVGKHRRLYYLELISRFAHHPAIVWNIGEESGPSDWKIRKGLKGIDTEQQRAIIRFLDENDPYGNLVLIHSHAGEQGQEHVLNPLLGGQGLDGVSLQCSTPSRVHADILKWTRKSKESNRAWLVSMDEIGPANYGAQTDSVDPTQDKMRADVLWGSLMAGAAGVEWYFGYTMAENDLNTETLRTRAELWKQSRIAKTLFSKLDVSKMQAVDNLLEGRLGFCSSIGNETYLVYLRSSKEDNDRPKVDLSSAAGKRFKIQWLNPVTGKYINKNSVTIEGGKLVDLGNPPGDSKAEWIVVLNAL
ncbi:MAG: DUF5060 domain-containing protein [Planctomycetota bacterium]